MRQELQAYGEGLADKAEILALNKVDALDAETRAAKAAELEAAAGAAPRLVSGVSGEGVTELLRESFREVRRARGEIAADDEAEVSAPSGDWAP